MRNPVSSKRSRLNVIGLIVLITILVTVGIFAVPKGKAESVVGDLNGDGVVNIFDLSILLSDWGDQGTSADLNGDGTVNIFDLSVLLTQWGQSAPSAGCTNNDILAPCIGSPTTGAAGWGTPVFDDEFTGTSLNTNNWSSSWFDGATSNNVSTSPANVSVADGNLILTLSSSTVGALVSSNPLNGGGAKVGFQFGTGYFVEGRIFFPGNGATVYNWPAFWTDGQSWPADGEIDIAEGLGQLTSNYHSSSGANNGPDEGSGWASGWHTYAVDRENGQNTVYWDGQIIRQYATNDGGSPHYLILNVGCSSNCVTGAASQVLVDYVRVWKKS